MMGDLVLLQEEVNPVMSALLEHGLEVTRNRKASAQGSSQWSRADRCAVC